MFENLLNTLRSDGSIIVNKALAKNIGLNPAVIYSELISKYKYFKDREMLFEFDGKKHFFCTVDDLKEATTIPRDAQIKAINTLIHYGLVLQVNKKPKGFDTAKRFFHIVDDMNLLLSLLGEKTTSETANNPGNRNIDSRKSENRLPTIENRDTNNTKYNNTKYNNTTTTDIEIKPKAKPKKKHIEKPVVVEPIHDKDIIKLKTDIDTKLNIDFSKKNLKNLVKEKGVDKIRHYLDNLNDYIMSEPDDMARMFYDMVKNEYKPIATNNNSIKRKNTAKPANMCNFDQRIYSDDDYDNLYCNL